MSQTDKRVEAVAALIADRRKYESWLAALEAKRAETPDHVFFRVRSDYERRLSEVLDQLRAQATALNERAESLTTRLATLVEEERAGRDRRAEGELRAGVGEISRSAWDALLKETADTTARIAAERSTIQTELAEIRELLDGGKGGAASRQETRGAGRPEPKAPATPDRSSGGSLLPTEPPDLPPDELAFLRRLITPETPGKAAPPAASAPGASFPQTGVVVKESELLLDPSRSGRDTPPLSMNVPESQSVVIRPDERDAKTMKCAECGALNIPTEWYCESCGSELAPS
jgi:hypothetical protein